MAKEITRTFNKIICVTIKINNFVTKSFELNKEISNMELLIIFCHLNVRAPTFCSYSTSLDINHVVGKKRNALTKTFH